MNTQSRGHELAYLIIVMQFINDFKRAVLGDDGKLRRRRMCLQQEELDAYWQSRTLTEMSRIMSIANPYILNFIVSELLQNYLSARKVTHEAFIVSQVTPTLQEKLCMYVYDCKIFRNVRFAKEQNDFLTAFLALYKQDVVIGEPVFEIVDVDSLPVNEWILVVKESTLLRTYNYMRESIRRTAHPNDKIVMEEDRYFPFMQSWLKCYYCYNLDLNVRHSFQAILVLLQNQLLLSYLSTLSEEQKYQRMYKRPIRKIEKPKNKQQFTLTQNHFGEISWQTLKITAFKLKYIVKEDEQYYNCYLMEEREEAGYELQQLQMQDKNILLAFDKRRMIDEEYSSVCQQ